MDAQIAKTDIINRLQKEVLALQGYKRLPGVQTLHTGVASLEAAFPDNVFPTGVVHEFISRCSEDGAATHGFIAALLNKLILKEGFCLWISTRRSLFPPALKLFGIVPERVIFIDCHTQKQALWAIEEALKCKALTAVVSELPELSFKDSRRLQLAVEESNVTGFIHRHKPKTDTTVACMTRWKIKSLPSELQDGMPGVGFPRWRVQLLKVRNGKPGSWDLEWAAGAFRYIARQTYQLPEVQTRKAV